MITVEFEMKDPVRVMGTCLEGLAANFGRLASNVGGLKALPEDSEVWLGDIYRNSDFASKNFAASVYKKQTDRESWFQ